MADLDQILDGEQPQEEPQAVAENQLEAQDEPQEEPQQEEAKAEEVKAEEPQTVPVAVVQELRRELRELKAQRQQQPEQPAPDVFEDPRGYQTHLQQQVQSSVNNVKLDISEEMTRAQYGDELVEAAFAAFQAKGDATLHQQVLNTRNPWGELVKWHQGQELSREIGGDPAAYKAKVEAELRAKIEAELVAKQAKEAAQRAAPSMANVTGTGGGAKTNWTGPASLENVIGD